MNNNLTISGVKMFTEIASETKSGDYLARGSWTKRTSGNQLFLDLASVGLAWGRLSIRELKAVYLESYDNSRLEAILFPKKRMGKHKVPD